MNSRAKDQKKFIEKLTEMVRSENKKNGNSSMVDPRDYEDDYYQEEGEFYYEKLSGFYEEEDALLDEILRAYENDEVEEKTKGHHNSLIKRNSDPGESSGFAA